MICRSPIPLGGRVHLDFSSGRSFRRSRSSLGRLGRVRGPRVLVGRSVIPQVGPGRRYLTGPNPGRGLGHGRIQRAEGTGVSVGRYVCPGRRLGSRCPGENRVRRESGVPDVTHRPLVQWPMTSAIGQGTSWFAGRVYAIRMGTDRYGRKRLG